MFAYMLFKNKWSWSGDYDGSITCVYLVGKDSEVTLF